MYMYVCVYIYIYIFICVYISLSLYICIYTYIYTQTTHKQHTASINIFAAPRPLRVPAKITKHTTHTKQTRCVYIYMYIYTCMYNLSLFLSLSMYVYIYILYIYIYIHIHTCTHVYTRATHKHTIASIKISAAPRPLWALSWSARWASTCSGVLSSLKPRLSHLSLILLKSTLTGKP